MASFDLALSAYLQLAAISHQRGQWLPRNKFLILAGDAACQEGFPSVAESCRNLVLANNRAHIVGRYDSFLAAMKSMEFQTYLKQQRKFCSVERAEHLLVGQGETLHPATTESTAAWLDQMLASQSPE